MITLELPYKVREKRERERERDTMCVLVIIFFIYYIYYYYYDIIMYVWTGLYIGKKKWSVVHLKRDKASALIEMKAACRLRQPIYLNVLIIY